ncbi:alpha/beta fold hydrolase [Aphanizomenon flos-aquae NRERC-008]|jgi:pimeloyl-ACP methyl ester carboxylesterase|uniref:Alpha/beta fold hydrolase n=1 Tax=Aphanizomenon flos-aquae FACHB-1249 TaxID=2692889 RepID=A0ABR8IVU8_APHFL|nr:MULTISPECIES: alpha/beta fold hydrolase [Aphanizomenon]OBQ21018.1 MAG: alpha/beta hydrolase [Anabaena sp. WA113]MBD2391525.1 alpha/beta fold hydrolase [Aphanizomenon flos-aquae FACHB-1171]MBD2556032.1 alpha/beta fold hydrolase [Aphanizomenon flos-aquae FACHB-1290]MBD2633166.1 alpha/beta fold hydrolase [Aphanizomenon sp. FACHB-1399]MBD2643799.1 alpha/beta fold hydrolase [Aphanizomenon sp. FACHB-1401]
MQTRTDSSTNPIPGQYWQWRGHRVYYVQAGEAQPLRPPLLLVHGFGASTDHWRKNITELSADFQVFAIDLLGFGRSSKPNLQYSGKLWRDQLHDFISEIICRKTILAGNSLGGYACLCVASQCPDSAAGLVLINSAGSFSQPENQIQPSPNPVQKLLGKPAKWLFKQRLLQTLLFQYTRQKWVIRRTLEKVYLDKGAVTDQLVEEIYRPAFDEGAIDVFISVFSTPQGEKVDVLLKQLTYPLLLIWGEADPWMRVRESSRKFHEYYPQLTEYFLTAGHCPHDEIPEQVNSHLREWATSLS